MTRLTRSAVLAVLALSLSACQTTNPETILSKKGAVELRSMQVRAFETNEGWRVYRAVVGTLQDLGYTITKVEPNTNTVTADKLAMLTLTATVYSRGENRTIVRTNAVVKMSPVVPQGYQVDSPEFYQQRFFEPLAKSLFLTALQVSDPADAEPQASNAAPPATNQ